jgi:hypothetical protein
MIELMFEQLALLRHPLPRPAAACQKRDTPSTSWRRFRAPVGHGQEMEKAMIVDHGLDLRKRW